VSEKTVKFFLSSDLHLHSFLSFLLDLSLDFRNLVEVK
jgi:hypothetical protein